MRTRPAVLVLCALAVTAGCSQRQRSNIFDPGNPITRGQPIGFAAVAGNGVVRISWQPISAQGLIGYELLRRLEGEAGYTPISGLLPGSESGFSDFGTMNGVDHRYQLYYVFSGGRGGLPAEDVATPGPLRAWLADLDGRLLRAAPDARRLAQTETGFSGPSHVAANPISGLVWISNPPSGEVVLFNPGLGSALRIGGFTRPGAIALDPGRRIAWVCDDIGGLVQPLSESGARVSPRLGPFDDPLACAVDVNDGSVWVCENRGNRVRRFTSGGDLIVDLSLARPSRAAVDPVTRDVWITSLDQASAFRFALGGTRLVTVPLAGPVGVAVDGERERVWIADAAGAAVVVLDRDGNTRFRVGGLAGVTEIAVDPRTGDAWTSRPDAGEVVRIAADGSRVFRLRGLGRPYGIGLANAPD